MDRRCFITWITGVGATLTLPSRMRPTRKWEPAQEFWVTGYSDRTLFVPVFDGDRKPPFQYGHGWERQWYRNIEPNFPLGAGIPDGRLEFSRIIPLDDVQSLRVAVNGR